MPALAVFAYRATATRQPAFPRKQRRILPPEHG
jgi:hypothetical protein